MSHFKVEIIVLKPGLDRSVQLVEPGLCEGLPLVNYPGVFPGIAPEKFARSSCSWHSSLANCMISYNELSKNR